MPTEITARDVLSLFLRTYYDGSRHGFSATWQENMEAVAEDARRLLSTPDATPDLVRALVDLVSADNCNYTAETMRYEGLFDRARAALAAASVDLTPPAERTS